MQINTNPELPQRAASFALPAKYEVLSPAENVVLDSKFLSIRSIYNNDQYRKDLNSFDYNLKLLNSLGRCVVGLGLQVEEV